jgi:hypothetical protein
LQIPSALSRNAVAGCRQHQCWLAGKGKIIDVTSLM